MPSITPEAREKLDAYLRFQRELGMETVRFPSLATAVAKPAAPGRPSPAVHTPASRAPRPEANRAALLQSIQEEIGPDCQRCNLARLGRSRIVFGQGNPDAELVFVGEGPGADEDAQGLPFVGRAGQLLTDMIQKGMGLRREDIYICNVVKCRPPQNRTPEPDECATCSPFLMRQLAAIRPRIICALGSTAAQALRPFRGSLGSVRGVIHPIRIAAGEDAFDTQLVITYHPAYLLRDPSQKREAWKDLQIIMTFLGIERQS